MQSSAMNSDDGENLLLIYDEELMAMGIIMQISKQVEMGDDKPKHSNIGASFVKVLDRDFFKQLEIPQEFIANFKGYRPHRFIIESSMTKKCWRLEVEEDGDGRMYFRAGWDDFVEAHSLEVGNVLVFEYEEQSIFQVKIYGRNGCEQTIVVDAKSRDRQKLQNTLVIEDDKKDESFDCEPKKVIKRTRQNTRTLPFKYEQDIYKRHHRVDRAKKRVSSLHRNQKRGTNVSFCKNSVCFSITMHKRKKHLFYQVCVPAAVSRQNKLSCKEKLELQDAKGNRWPVKVNHDRKGRMLIGRGWRDFLDGNKIASGDTLKFEFTSDDIVQVHVTRDSKVEHDEEKYQNKEATGSSLDLDSKDDELVTYTTEDKATEDSITRKRVSSKMSSSSFSFVWGTKTIGNYLYIPKAVGQRLKDKDSVVIRDPEGKCWPLEVRKRYDGRVALTKGWSVFWMGHGITPGDSLRFEFVSDFLIQVTINRGNLVDNSKAIGNEGVATELEMADKAGASVEFEASDTD